MLEVSLWCVTSLAESCLVGTGVPSLRNKDSPGDSLEGQAGGGWDGVTGEGSFHVTSPFSPWGKECHIRSLDTLLSPLLSCHTGFCVSASGRGEPVLQLTLGEQEGSSGAGLVWQ